MASEADPKEAEFIRSAIAEEGKTWCEKLDAIIEWAKKNKGLKYWHASAYPKEDGSEPDKEEIAHDLCLLRLAVAEGHTRDITGEEL